MLNGLEIMRQHKTNFISISERLDLNTSMGHVMFVLISAMAQLERDLISERVRCGTANAKAKGVRIGRERKRNSVLIESLLDAQLSYREIARIAKCSHGSVHAQKKEYLARKQATQKLRAENLEKQAAEIAAQSPTQPMSEMNLSEDMIAKINLETERKSIASTPSLEGTAFYEGAD